MKRIAPSPRQAYLDADYAVLSDPPFILRIGEASEALARLYARLGCERCACLTACNPRSRALRPAANARRMRALAAALARGGWHAIAAESRDPAGDWPAEPSLLVPGMGIPEALGLARRFGQNAFVAAGPRAVPELVWAAPVHAPSPSARQAGASSQKEQPCIES